MGHSPLVATGLLLALLATGCASLPGVVLRTLRRPGERIASFPEVVWQEHGCDEKPRPHFALETNELVPAQVKAGSRFNHRMVYAMCPKRPTEVITGRLFTRIRFRGDPIVRERTEAYEIKPGRWVVDAEVTLPAGAEAGVYAYEIEFESEALDFEESLTFVVER